PQLKELWRTNRFLSTRTLGKAALDILPSAARKVFEGEYRGQMPMAQVLAETFAHDGFRYVPLIWKEADLGCSVRILCLRRDGLESVAAGRDIDNRIKTVIDALTMVLHKQGTLVDKQGNKLTPSAEEDPFFVLLDDDRQITHLEVETDNALVS